MKITKADSPETNPIEVVVYVRGGVVCEVGKTHPSIKVTVIDFDEEDATPAGEEYKPESW